MKIDTMLVISFIYTDDNSEPNNFDEACSELFDDMGLHENHDYFYWQTDWCKADYPIVYSYIKKHLDAVGENRCLIVME